MRLWPQSLFGRLLMVLAGGMLVAQLLSAAINFAERDSLLRNASGMQRVQRMADVVLLLDSMSPSERERIVAVLSVPPLVLSLHDAPAPADPALPAGARAQMFAAMLHATLGQDRAIRVDPVAATADHAPAWPQRQGQARRYGMMGRGPNMGEGGPEPDAVNGRNGSALRTQVQLLDGRWARFDTLLPAATERLPWRLALTLLLLFGAVLALSLVAVRWVTRPLHALATAAEGLGQDIHRPPLPETGPLEIAQAARAFNTMQGNLVRLIDGRTQVLTAMSHDLKTPITRMRLRADLLDDEALRERFESDLKEMEAMVSQALDFMRGLGDTEARQPTDLNALLAGLQRDQQAMGRSVRIEGRATAVLDAKPGLLKRCLGNLIDNAVLYGGSATVRVQESENQLTLRVQDNGPGLPPDELDKVFAPFYRVEASRNRASGGTGLGLPIARSIAQLHGGDLRLHNRPEGGLEAVLTLPRNN